MMIVAPALLGLVFCLLNAAGADLFCLTSGCALYAGYSLFGVSFYAYGAMGFGTILVLALCARRMPLAVKLLFWVIFIGLFLDVLFLGWQILYWPCLSCLVVAVLLGWTAVAFWLRYAHEGRRLLQGVFLIWVFFLIPVGIAAGKELFLSPWPIYGAQDAPIHVFFSPTCPACGTEVAKLLQSPYADRAAFFPVAKDGRDLKLFAAFLQEKLDEPQDLRRLFLEEPDGEVSVPLVLRWRLARNTMALAGYGAQSIPFILSPTVLEIVQAPFDGALPTSNPWEPVDVGGCGFFGAQDLPCD
ncbi:hypothetical protein SAMN05660860_03344 [Geoalkalibacter ferrihydriticus]|uniref:Vitamin K epoxide reductase domain-containing protein n=2 Tax=Geoalkalibacter ferrihydriticus TaxID=392333 RepID=A0A0C2EAC4_9BACT|nr:hypothetical protein [Geoalkalibacter ferrihydriticus]KIH75528.1 hypothetical protein GFER_16430 [Geoalkalibacter ferrihydriticus DSM 17813]SDM89158.1 hypothetical protein SAMN05660860_03344 [Geoalkalibacter ferrihydriticus]